jgi:D-arabinose 1-dehydrogenase-like Zn-dependent alcohol dehydrogenase
MRGVTVESFGGTECLTLRELPVPEPGRGEVLLQVGACGVCGQDVLRRQGKLDRILGPVIGHEMAGTVAAVGEGVRDFAVGDRVAGVQRKSCHRCRACLAGREVLCPYGEFYGEQLQGAYADYVVVDELSLARIPDNVSMAAGAIAACAIGTGLHALRLAGVVAGQRVLVTGPSGGVGMHAMQLVRAMGAEVVAVTSSPEKTEQLEPLADAVVVMRDGRFDREIRDRRLQPHVVLDLTARITLPDSLRAVQRGGTVVIVGNIEAGTVEILPGAFIVREITLVGSKACSRLELEETLGFLARGQVEAVLQDALPLERAAEAHERLEAKAVRGRLVLEPGRAAA